MRWISRINCIPLLALAVLVPATSYARVIGRDDAVPVVSLATNDPTRQAGRPVGQLRAELPDGTQQTCTAVIISDRHILTAFHCAAITADMTAVFGHGEQDVAQFRVQTPPIEMNKELGYAVLEVEGTPSRKFGAAKLLLRIPIKGESAFVLSVDHEGEKKAAGNCSVLGIHERRGTALHDCDTTPGSSGGLLFSSKDMAILGLHIGSDDAFNQALPMYSVALASDLVRGIATVRPPTIDFRTVGNKADDIALDFKRLYLTLHNTLRLPVRPYEVENFTTIEDVFRSNQLFYGSPFPLDLDSLACDLNVDVCSREKIKATPDELASPIGHVSGYKPSVGRWSVIARRSLFLPSVRFDQQRDWVVYRKRSGQQIGDIVTRELRGCERFDDECRNLIIRVNRDQEERLTPEYSGIVLLPKPSFSARDLDISTGLEKGGSRTIEIKPASSDQGSQLVLQPSGVSASRATRQPETDFRVLQLPGAQLKVDGRLPADLDAVLRSLGTRASGTARISPNSSHHGASPPRCNGDEANPCELDPEDFSKYHKRLLDSVGFPYRDLSQFPAAIQKRGGRLGIIDTDFDLGHCAFEKLRDANRLVPIRTTVSPSANMDPGYTPCTWLKPRLQIESRNHGTHVAGLMAGKISDKLWGLNPFATLYAGQVTPTTVGQQKIIKTSEVADVLRKMLEEASPLDVVNISLYYEKDSIVEPGGGRARPLGDPVLDLIRTHGYETLFVVAAGNDGEDFTAICDLRPACLDLPNVISVAALDGEGARPALYSPSNYGRRIHVGASGRDVLSLVNGNYLGLLSGTSQAAPQVAAIASLLRALRPNATPAEIKERLITCSLPVPARASATDHDTQDAGAIFGGRVDATCALKPEGEGMLQLEKSKETFRVRSVGATPDLTFKSVFSDYQYDIVVPQKSLRGLQGNQGEFTILTKRAWQNPNAPLAKEERIRPVPDTQNLEVEIWDETLNPPGWSKRDVPLGRIARFSAPMLRR